MALLAQATRVTVEDMIYNSFIFGVIGIVMLVLSYFIFDLVVRKIDFTRELVENKNIAVAIVVGAFLLGVAHVIASVVGG